MIDDFDDKYSTLRMLVATALRNPSWTIDGLINLLKEEDVIVRTAAARELQIRGGEPVFKKILPFVSSKQACHREIAAFVLGQLGTPMMDYKNESLPILVKLALDEDEDVRAASAAAFGHLCYEGMSEQIEDILIRLCNDESIEVRACAAYALGNSSGNRKIRELLESMVNQDYVGSYAELGLELIEDHKG